VIVVDASVVITCLLPESESQAARNLIASEFCVAPDLLVSECVNAFWKTVQLGRILRSEAEMALETLPHLGVGLVPSQDLADRAMALAIDLRHPAYDCFYLALAESRRVPLITQDKTLVHKVRSSSACTAPLRLLAETIA